MMLATERQNRLTPILEDLQAISGITCVQQDDFNSHAIDVFLTLTPEGDQRRSGRYGPTRWEVPLRTIKAAIHRAINAKGRDFRFLDQPRKRRERNGSLHGKPYYHDLGYDKDEIKLEIHV